MCLDRSRGVEKLAMTCDSVRYSDMPEAHPIIRISSSTTADRVAINQVLLDDSLGLSLPLVPPFHKMRGGGGMKTRLLQGTYESVPT